MDDKFGKILAHYLSDKSTALWRAKAEPFLRQSCPDAFDLCSRHDDSNRSHWARLAVVLASKDDERVLRLLSKDLSLLSPFEALSVLDHFPKVACILKDDDLVDLLDGILLGCPAAEPKLLYVLRQIIASKKWGFESLRSKYGLFYPVFCRCLVLCLDAFPESIELTDDLIKVTVHSPYWDNRVFRRVFNLVRPQSVQLECGCFECTSLFIIKSDLGLSELQAAVAGANCELSSKELKKIEVLFGLFMELRHGIQVAGSFGQQLDQTNSIPQTLPVCDDDDYATLMEMLDHDHDHVVGYNSCCAECYCD